MSDRSRIRTGRGVLYLPTPTEAAAGGEGPWAAKITRVHSDGTVDLVSWPSNPAGGTALADPLVTQADADAPGGAYAQAEAASAADLANANKAAINALVTRLNEVGATKARVEFGARPGQFTTEAGPSAV